MKKKMKASVLFRKMIHVACSDYRQLLGVSDYEIKIVYKDDDRKSTTMRDENGDYDVLADCKTDRRYLVATINIYPVLWVKWQKKQTTTEDVLRTIAHECAHIATEHLFTLAVSIYKDSGEMEDAHEMLTERFSRVVYQLERDQAELKRLRK